MDKRVQKKSRWLNRGQVFNIEADDFTIYLDNEMVFSSWGIGTKIRVVVK